MNAVLGGGLVEALGDELIGSRGGGQIAGLGGIPEILDEGLEHGARHPVSQPAFGVRLHRFLVAFCIGHCFLGPGKNHSVNIDPHRPERGIFSGCLPPVRRDRNRGNVRNRRAYPSDDTFQRDRAFYPDR